MSSALSRFVAADFGAGSGRIFSGAYDGRALQISQIHRFSNEPVRLAGFLHWNFPRLFQELLSGLGSAAADGPVQAIGVDTWGLDFGLIGEAGDLLALPGHHRDERNALGMDHVLARHSRERIFRSTAIQFLQINTLYQLAAMQMQRPYLLQAARRLLFMPDLFHYFLTGVVASEYTIASTSQLLDAQTKLWDEALIADLEFPRRLFGDIVHPGSILGTLRADIVSAPGRTNGLAHTKVIAVGAHDTASAVLGAPAQAGKPFAYISCGTWSLMGTEIAQPIRDDKALRLNVSNEGGVEGSIRLLKNIMGLWILQECVRDWTAAGLDVTYESLLRQAEGCRAFGSYVDPDDVEFLTPGNMVVRIERWCQKRSMQPPQSPGEVTRCILESLACKYRMVLEQLEDVLGCELSVIHLVGGGANNRLLCQWTANATGRLVMAGPVEATALGNLAMQLRAFGEVSGLSEMRDIIRRSARVTEYEPHDRDLWETQYGVFATGV
ncbi:MAG: rhamnulokinase [Bacilli bacterium]